MATELTESFQDKAQKLLDTYWLPSERGHSLSTWRVTETFISSKGRVAVELRRISGGPHSVKIIYAKDLYNRYKQTNG